MMLIPRYGLDASAVSLLLYIHVGRRDGKNTHTRTNNHMNNHHQGGHQDSNPLLPIPEAVSLRPMEIVGMIQQRNIIARHLFLAQTQGK